MERSKRRRSRPSIEGLEGRMLLSVDSTIPQPRHVDKYSPLRQTTTNTAIDYTTPQGSVVDVKLIGPGSLNGSTVDAAGDLNLVFTGTNVFSSIIGTVKGGSGTANLATITSEKLPVESLSGIGGDLIGRVLLPSFNLIAGGQVNLTAGVQSFSLNSVTGDSQVHLRDTPLNTTLGLQSYENTVTGTGVTYARLSSTSTGATSSSATGLSSGTSIGVATGQSAGGVTTINAGTLDPTAVGFGGGEVGSVNGAIPIINTVGNGENALGTPGLTQTQVSQGRTTNYITGNDGGTQLSNVAGTFAPGLNLIEPSDISLPAKYHVPPPGVVINIKHVNGGPTQATPPLGDPLIYGYDANINALIKFDATSGARLQTIPLPASTTKVGGVSLARDGAELVVLVGIGAEVLAFDATTGAAVGQFALSTTMMSAGFATVSGIATGGQMTVLEDAEDGSTGTIQAINVAQSLATGQAVASASPFSPTNEFALAGTVTGIPGTGNIYALGSAFFDTTQPNLKQAGILAATPNGVGIAESSRTALFNPLTSKDLLAGTNNGIAGSPTLAIGSLDSLLAVDAGVVNGMNLLNLYAPNGLTSKGSFTLDDANPLADLTQSFHPELNSTALIDVQGNVQSFTGKTAEGLVLNVAGNFDQLTISNASNSTVVGLPFAHVNIPVRNNVTITTNSRLVGSRNGVTLNESQQEVGPLFLD